MLQDLVEGVLVLDAWLAAEVTARAALALAEGMVRGYALARGVEVR